MYSIWYLRSPCSPDVVAVFLRRHTSNRPFIFFVCVFVLCICVLFFSFSFFLFCSLACFFEKYMSCCQIFVCMLKIKIEKIKRGGTPQLRLEVYLLLTISVGLCMMAVLHILRLFGALVVHTLKN